MSQGRIVAAARRAAVAGLCRWATCNWATCSWAAAVALSSMACSTEPSGQVQLATWWGARGEFDEPFETLKQHLRESSGLDVEIVNRLSGKGYHMQWVDEQLNPETPSPAALDAVAYNNGGDVLRWTPCAPSPHRPMAARLRALDDPKLGPLRLDADWIERSFDADVLNTLSCDGHVYALPVGIHRINTLLFNKRLFRSAGYDVDGDGSGPLQLPASLDELEAAAQLLQRQLDARGSDSAAAVFALPRSDNWTLSLFFIENVMLAGATAAPYQDYWSGAVCDSQWFARALQRVRALEPYFSTKALNEKDAIQELSVGDAAMLVTGDWAAAEVEAEDVGQIEFPGTRGLFVFTADVFVLPDLPTSDPDKGLAWLRAVTGWKAQREFARLKHALPTRADDPERKRAGIWVPSLPAYLPGTEPDAPKGYEEPFQSLSAKLQEWLESTDRDAANARLEQYAAQECVRPRLTPRIAGGPTSAPVQHTDPEPAVDAH